MFNRWSAPHLSILKWACHLVMASTRAGQQNNVWSAPAGSAITVVSHRSHNVRTANRHLCAKARQSWLLDSRFKVFKIICGRAVIFHYSLWLKSWENSAQNLNNENFVNIQKSMRCKFPYNENFMVLAKNHASGNGNLIINFAWPKGERNEYKGEQR